ncbi:Hypothetical protein NTJ_03425 [Nesidiocoris tenuis]|uniref:Secreted protein n=1 Tax=Nesidiocoris tenuis TaxID=355587 RepID=A0ABN7AH61_9HEMI|nr:Hypothetical protein NTJ_03425 [Nesidiocoris tenuis]
MLKVGSCRKHVVSLLAVSGLPPSHPPPSQPQQFQSSCGSPPGLPQLRSNVRRMIANPVRCHHTHSLRSAERRAKGMKMRGGMS